LFSANHNHPTDDNNTRQTANFNNDVPQGQIEDFENLIDLGTPHKGPLEEPNIIIRKRLLDNLELIADITV